MSTISDVAKLAGVSSMTVSRVLSGTGNVHEASQMKVLHAVEVLGYTRNHAASSLRRRGKPNWTIGLVLENVANPYQAQLHREIEDAARAHGSFVLAASTDEDSARMRDIIREFQSREVDGLVVAPPPGDQSALALARRQGMPVVLVDRPAVGIVAPAVMSDGRRGTQEAVEHLRRHGHRRIAYVTDLRSATMQDRHAGFLDGFMHSDLELAPELLFTQAVTTQDAVHATEALFALGDPPTAIVTGRDGMTVGVTAGLHQLGLQHRVAMVGFDDVELAALVEPGLTVVAQNPVEVGRLAAELLLAKLPHAEESAEELRVPTTFIPRGSGEIPYSSW